MVSTTILNNKVEPSISFSLIQKEQWQGRSENQAKETGQSKAAAELNSRTKRTTKKTF